MRHAILLAAVLMLAACSTATESHPPRTATEELLISTAAERAAAGLDLSIPKGAKVFLETSNFEGTDSKNAIAAIRESLMQQGASLVDDKKTASIIVEIRAGALSVNQDGILIGIPSFAIPIPFASVPFTFPEIAFYKSDEDKGVAKFAANATKQGKLLAAPAPQFGYAHDTKKEFLFISWEDSDIWPEDTADKKDAAVGDNAKKTNN